MFPINNSEAGSVGYQEQVPSPEDAQIVVKESFRFLSGVWTSATTLLSDHVWEVGAVTTVCLAIGYWVFAKSPDPVRSVEEFVIQAQDLALAEQKALIKDFVQRSIHSESFHSSARLLGSDFERFLEIKTRVIINADVDPVLKSRIITNVFRNLCQYISTAAKTIQNDIEQGVLSCLDISPSDAIKEIRPLGDETHNGSRIPLLIFFESGAKVVYKPRSMLPELLIHGSTCGILSEYGMGYHVVDLQGQDGQEYGYAEFIENLQEENTIFNLAQLNAYVQKVRILARVAKELSLSDLHYLNVITRQLNPCIIDAEVFLVPGDGDSGLLSDKDGVFVFREEGLENAALAEGKNKIHFDRAIAVPSAVKLTDTDQKIRHETLAQLDIPVCLADDSEWPESLNESVAHARRRLLCRKGRLILIGTQTLKTLQPRLDLGDDGAEVFIQTLKANIEKQGFVFDESKGDEIRQQLDADTLNHDIPAFYHKSQTGEVFYGDVLIGCRRPFD